MIRRVLGAAALAIALLVAGAGPAAAHAVLEATTPGDGAHVDTAPSVVTLTFSENVSAALGAVRAFDQDGHRVDEGDVEVRDKTVTLGLRSGLGDGSYVVTWRVVSADSHPVRGAFTFTVGSGPEASDSLVASLFDSGADRVWEVTSAVGRWLAYTGTLLAAGGALFLALVHDGGRERRALVKVVLGAALVGALGMLVTLPMSAALATGLGLGAIAHAGVLGQVLGDGVGWSTALGLAGLAALAAALSAPPTPLTRVTGLAGATLAAISFTFAGHTTTTAPRWLALSADAIHVAAAAAWLGGLVLLALTLRMRRARAAGAAATETGTGTGTEISTETGTDAGGGTAAVPAGAMVARFSMIAAVSVLAVGVAGGALAWAEVRALHALTSTTYGWLLLAKVGVVLAVGLIGAYNRYRLVPALQRAEQRGKDAWHHLRRTVRLESLGLVVALGLTAVLVNVTPARSAAGIGTIYSRTVALGDDSVNLVVDPNRAGVNAIHLYLLDETGRPAALAQDLRLELTMPANDLGPIERTPFVAGPGHYQLDGSDLSIAGTWHIDVVAKVSDFEERTASFDVPVNP